MLFMLSSIIIALFQNCNQLETILCLHSSRSKFVPTFRTCRALIDTSDTLLKRLPYGNKYDLILICSYEPS
jgi:hypothetical protein